VASDGPDAAQPAAPSGSTTESGALGTTKGSPFKVQGIYLQQNTAQSRARLDHLISNSLEVGINTFIVDLETRSNYYKKGIEHLQEQGIEYVPRITMFPNGGTHEQIIDRAYWEDRYKLASYAIDLGAKSVQIDYIRYSSKTAASADNAINVREVLRFLKKRISGRGALLQIDVFGEVSYAPSLHIGQDMALFAKEIDTVCPMVYPSHYEPYEEHAQTPYETVFGSLTALKRQIGNQKVSVLAYIELFNYRHKLDTDERVKYIRAELRAVREANADGWLAWSAGNKYDILFDLMRRYRNDAASESL